jgi:hypothetical protein
MYKNKKEGEKASHFDRFAKAVERVKDQAPHQCERHNHWGTEYRNERYTI